MKLVTATTAALLLACASLFTPAIADPMTPIFFNIPDEPIGSSQPTLGKAKIPTGWVKPYFCNGDAYVTKFQLAALHTNLQIRKSDKKSGATFLGKIVASCSDGTTLGPVLYTQGSDSRCSSDVSTKLDRLQSIEKKNFTQIDYRQGGWVDELYGTGGQGGSAKKTARCDNLTRIVGFNAATLCYGITSLQFFCVYPS